MNTKFQARHYWAIADLLKNERPIDGTEQLTYWEGLVDTFADMFARDHPGFKHGRFISAVNGEIGNKRYGVTKNV